MRVRPSVRPRRPSVREQQSPPGPRRPPLPSLSLRTRTDGQDSSSAPSSRTGLAPGPATWRDAARRAATLPCGPGSAHPARSGRDSRSDPPGTELGARSTAARPPGPTDAEPGRCRGVQFPRGGTGAEPPTGRVGAESHRTPRLGRTASALPRAGRGVGSMPGPRREPRGDRLRSEAQPSATGDMGHTPPPRGAQGASRDSPDLTRWGEPS